MIKREELEPDSELETEIIELFKAMRDATPEEYESVNNYIKNISKETRVMFA